MKKIKKTSLFPKYLIVLLGGILLSSVLVFADTTITTNFSNAVQYIQKIVLTDDGSASGNTGVVLDGSGQKIQANQYCDLAGSTCKTLSELINIFSSGDYYTTGQIDSFGFITGYTETDPKIGTLTQDKRCYATGGIIECTQNDPSGVGGTWSTGTTPGEIYYNGGNVGIGMSDPAYTLDVNGNTRIGGNMYINGNTYLYTPVYIFDHLTLDGYADVYGSLTVGTGHTNADKYGSILGGQENSLLFYNDGSPRQGINNVIGGGSGNTIAGKYNGILGGKSNSILNHQKSTIVGGEGNSIHAPVLPPPGTDIPGDETIINGYYNSIINSPFSLIAGGKEALISGHDGVFLRSDSLTTGFTAANNDTFLINATNGVGINTNDPQYDLDVNGTGRFNEVKTDILRSKLNDMQILSDNTLTIWGDTELSASADMISFTAGDRTKILGGNLGIGTTGAPAYKLDVNGTGRFSQDLLANKNLTVSQDIMFSGNLIDNHNNGDNMKFYHNGTTEGFELNLDGRKFLSLEQQGAAVDYTTIKSSAITLNSIRATNIQSGFLYLQSYDGPTEAEGAVGLFSRGAMFYNTVDDKPCYYNNTERKSFDGTVCND